jgi:hypothetical protein
VAIKNVARYVSTVNNGQWSSATIRKVPSQASTASWWVDLSMAAGIPTPNYYASEPGVSAVLNPMRGVNHGDNKSPAEKYVESIELMTPSAALVGPYFLLDYLMYYPFIDLDSLEPQALENTVSVSRYADGEGVMAMMVCAAPTTGGGSFTFTYVNQSGNTSVSPVISYTTAAASIGNIVTSQPAVAAGIGPFLPLASGDTGIRSITEITNLTGTGGLGTLVLVKPLASHVIYEINTPHEVEFVKDRPNLPRIYDGAYLNFIVQCASTVAAAILVGRLTTVWS